MMRHFPAALLLALALPALAQAALPGPVRRQLYAAGVPENALAVWIGETGARRPRIAHRAAEPLNPASTMKLVTTFAALDLLGPAYTWKTGAYIDGEIKEGSLSGNLYLKGSGDPKITFEDFGTFLHGLRANGLKDIRGDLVLDRSRFAPLAHDPAAFDNEPFKPYNVAPDALLFNFKTVRFIITPDADTQSLRVRAEPHPTGLAIDNRLKLVGGPCGDWKANAQARFASTAESASASFTGTYAAACEEKHWWVSLFDHAPFLAGSFRALWEEQGGTLSGGWREGPAPDNARLLGEWQSPPLAELVRDINKRSNNVMARELFLALAAARDPRPATPDIAREVLAQWLRARGLEFPELQIENGAGLARGDRISAEHLARLLQLAYASPVMPEFMASLPVAGTDGTLEHRLNGHRAAGMAHLKTGSLDDVRALAGFVLDRQGRRWVLVALVNHAHADAAQGALDALVDWVASAPVPARCRGCP